VINSNYTYAVVGASTNPEKYGFKVFADLLKAGYKVFAINPKQEKILGQASYASLTTVPVKIKIAIFVVPPQVTWKILPQLIELKIEQAWFQPGSFNQKILDYCDQHQLIYQADSCIMIERHRP